MKLEEEVKMSKRKNERLGDSSRWLDKEKVEYWIMLKKERVGKGKGGKSRKQAWF